MGIDFIHCFNSDRNEQTGAEQNRTEQKPRSERVSVAAQWISSLFFFEKKESDLLLQNVERGSRMMAKLRGTESARILHRRRDHRNVIIIEWWGHIQKWCVLDLSDRDIGPHRVSRSASAHCRRPLQWHHRSSSGVEDKSDPIRKTCDFMNISYRNDPEQVFPWKSLFRST